MSNRKDGYYWVRRMTTIHFFVPERPFAKKRARSGQGRVYTPAETVAAEAAVRHYARLALPEGFRPLEGPVRLTVEFRFARAVRQSAVTRASGWHAMSQGGDLSNLGKLVEDALNPAAGWPGVWLDDGQVADLRATKRWADDGHSEGTSVIVEAL